MVLVPRGRERRRGVHVRGRRPVRLRRLVVCAGRRDLVERRLAGDGSVGLGRVGRRPRPLERRRRRTRRPRGGRRCRHRDRRGARVLRAGGPDGQHPGRRGARQRHEPGDGRRGDRLGALGAACRGRRRARAGARDGARGRAGRRGPRAARRVGVGAAGARGGAGPDAGGPRRTDRGRDGRRGAGWHRASRPSAVAHPPTGRNRAYQPEPRVPGSSARTRSFVPTRHARCRFPLHA